MRRNGRVLLALGVAFTLIAGACGSDAAEEAAPAATTAAAPATTAAAPATPATTAAPTAPATTATPITVPASGLAAVCPSPLVIQTDWFPEAEHGPMYQMIGDGYSVDADNKVVSGPGQLGGAPLGIDIEVRTGGPAIGWAPVSSYMYTDDSIHLGYRSTDQQVLEYSDAPMLSVVAPLEKNPQMVMWDTDAHPNVRSLADLGSEGITINVFGGGTFADVFVAEGIWSADQVDPSYDGSPARFVADQTIAQQGFASAEPFQYEHVFEEYGKAVAFELLHDAGFQVYSQTVGIRPGDLEDLRGCLEWIVPVIQQSVVDYDAAPERANAMIVDAVTLFEDFWVYDMDLAAFSVQAQRDLGLVGNGPDGIVGNMDADRIQTVIDKIAAAGMDFEAGLSVSDIMTNEFIDTSISFPEYETAAPAPTTTAAPLEGAVIRVAVEADTDGLNPTVNRFAVSAYQMARAVYDPLVYVTEDPCGCVLAPGLAESWTVSDDYMTWDFKIRENVKFHDGTMLTGEAVVYAINQQLKDPLISLAFRPIFIPQGAVELVDDMTVRFNLQRPHVDFPIYLSTQLGLIPSLEYMMATISDQSLNQAPVGTGPFRFASREQDFMTRFERNDDYWGGEVIPAAIEVYVYTDTVLAADAMAVGDIDIMSTSNVDAILALRDLEFSGDVVLYEEDGGEEGFGMLNTSKVPFNDIRARKALAFSAPLDDYMEFIGQGVLRPADSWFPPESPYHNPNVEQAHDVLDQATPLVAEYCTEFPDNCADGRINMEFQYSGPSVIQERIYDILSEGWSDHFNVTKDMKPQDAHINEVAFGQYDFVTWRQMGIANPDGDVTWLNCTAVGFVSLNWPRLCDEERDALMYQARGSSNQDERIGLWQQVAEMINADYAYLMFNHTMWSHAYSPDVAGICDYRFPDGSVPRCNYSGYTDYYSQLDKVE